MEAPLLAEPVWPSAADVAEPAAAEPVKPPREDSAPAEVPPDALGTWIGIPWQPETDERVPTGALPIPDEHAAAEEWRRVSQEAEAAEAAARAEEAEPGPEGMLESAIEVEKSEPVGAEEPVEAEEVAAEEPAAAVEEVEAPAEEVAVEPAAEAEEAPVG